MTGVPSSRTGQKYKAGRDEPRSRATLNAPGKKEVADTDSRPSPRVAVNDQSGQAHLHERRLCERGDDALEVVDEEAAQV